MTDRRAVLSVAMTGCAPHSGEAPRSLDFVVGRRSLRKHLGTPLHPIVSVAPDFVTQLLLEQPSVFGSRVPLYVCPCGDPACGAVTAAVQAMDDVVVWSDFGEQSEPDVWRPIEHRSRAVEVGPFVFERAAYRQALEPHQT